MILKSYGLSVMDLGSLHHFFSLHDGSLQSINDRYLSWCATTVNQAIMTPVFIGRETVSLIEPLHYKT